MTRVALLVLLLVLPCAAGAAEEGWSYALADELMSPYCPGRALSECPSSQAEELRSWIHEQEASGVAREVVEAELYDRFGDALRQTPRVEGMGLVAYAVPALVFLAGAGFVWLFLARQRGSARDLATAEPATPAATPQADSELERLVDEELGRP